MTGTQRNKVWRHRRILTEHVFDKLWLLDLTLAEFRVLLDAAAEVIDEAVIADGQLKELVLYLDWSRPLHVVVVVDDIHAEERLITVYEPSTDRWSDDFRTRR
ncbi:MAG: hypothetical protein JJE52_04955 [Acidimicrobiia bacterium]|nr:hypothetical protein [Acidimicrobiia bacterium]